MFRLLVFTSEAGFIFADGPAVKLVADCVAVEMVFAWSSRWAGFSFHDETVLV